MNVPIFLLITLYCILPQSNGHGRLIEPPSRASAWRYGFNTPHNYNDHELFCGGFTRQWVNNGGKCGICGDAWDTAAPRPHDFGGTYGQGIIVRKYGSGSTITIRVELTASHMGYFEFGICPNYKNPSQECINKNLLRVLHPQDNVNHQDVRYFPKEGSKVYEMKYRLPKKTCEHCIMQWRYIAGNNWGNCPNGTGAVGCGPQEEFRACADISIVGKSTDETFTPEEDISYPIQPTSTLFPTLPTPDGPLFSISTFFISVISSFLVVSLIFFLLYFHFYQVGRQIKKWIKYPSMKSPMSEGPQPPPRLKRGCHPSKGTNINVI